MWYRQRVDLFFLSFCVYSDVFNWNAVSTYQFHHLYFKSGKVRHPYNVMEILTAV
jgi:hypothetical protein